MAITRLWQHGFTPRSVTTAFNGNYGVAHTSSSSFAPFDNLECVDIGGNSTGYKDIPATAQCRIGLYLMHDSVNTGDVPRLLTLRDTATDVIYITYNGYQFELFSGATSLGTAVSTHFWNQAKYHHISLDVKIDAVSGWAKFCVDGHAVFNYSGKTDHGAATFNRVALGTIASLVTWNGNTRVDDLYIEDTTGEGAASVAPPVHFSPIRPNGNGNYAQWDGSDGNSVDNYLLLDEGTVSASDYVSTGVSTERDSYAMTTVTLFPYATLNAFIPGAVALYGTPGEQLVLFSRLSGTDLDGTAQTLTATSFEYFERQTAKPGGGSWGQSDIDAVEVGVMMP